MNARYKTVDTLSLFHHQANHYKNIIKPKRTIIFPQNSTQNKQHDFLSILNNKHAKELQRDIKVQNRRMLKELMHLQKKKGLMQKAEQNYRIYTSNSKRLSLVNPYKAKQSQNQRQNANKTLQLKCKDIQPFVGSKKQWAKHQQMNKKITARLSNKSPFSKQVKNTQIFMQMMQTTDISGWVNIVKQNKAISSHQNHSKNKKSRSVHRKKKRNLSNLQKRQENLKDSFKIENIELNS